MCEPCRAANTNLGGVLKGSTGKQQFFWGVPSKKQKQMNCCPKTQKDMDLCESLGRFSGSWVALSSHLTQPHTSCTPTECPPETNTGSHWHLGIPEPKTCAAHSLWPPRACLLSAKLTRTLPLPNVSTCKALHSNGFWK